MNKIFLIISREYLVRVKKKSFLLTTFGVPILLALVMFGVIWMATSSTLNKVKTIAVWDESGLFENKLEGNSKIKLVFQEQDSNYDSLLKKVNDEVWYAVLHIPKISIEHPEGIKMTAKKSVSLEVERAIKGKLEKCIEDIKLTRSGIDQEVLENLKTNISISTENIKGEEKSSKIVYIIGFAAAFLIYLTVFIYGAQVMRGVIEEKTNRIVEVIISSVKPIQLMMGKIIGVALVGLTQFLLWIVLTFAVISVAGSFISMDQETVKSISENSQTLSPTGQEKMLNTDNNSEIANIIQQISNINIPLVIFSFLFYFLGGYLLYSALFAAIGAASDSETDSQQFMLPISMPLIISFVAAQLIINNPDGPLAFWMSMIPLTSPVIMMIRIPNGVPVWELLLSMSMLVIGFVFIAWLAARIYRVGILMHGKKVNFKTLWKWLSYRS